MYKKDLTVKLARAETEKEIIDILKKEKLWDDLSCWRPFGDIPNNFSVIGAQQESPDAALVEKVINSIDAVLMKECMVRGVDPAGPDAPKNMSDALQSFFKIREGKISHLDITRRTELARSIYLCATGKMRGAMNLSIIDKGEGQTPRSMPDTILSISKDNKMKIPFVQGQFNMGGTGALSFCGTHGIQIIISKRCPDIPNYNNDPTFDKWSVTVIRREPPRDGRKSSMFTYLTDKNGELFSFDTNMLPIIPKKYGDKGYDSMEYGTFIKLMDYALQGYKSNIRFNLNFRLSMLMPNLAHPIRLRECREFEIKRSAEATLSGLETRLLEDSFDNIEEGFPTSSTFVVDGQSIKCQVYVFRKGHSGSLRKSYSNKEGVILAVNGQTHAMIADSFFNKVSLSYLADSLLLLVDCSDIDVAHREMLFMNSRDRTRKTDFTREVENEIARVIKEHPRLKELQNERRQEAIKEKLDDDKPLQEAIESILSKSSVLSKVLLSGKAIDNPFNMSKSAGSKKEYKGKLHPTFFNLKGRKKDGTFIKTKPVNHDFRVQFETDVENSYFARESERGVLNLYLDDADNNDLIRSLNLYNGVASLTIRMPEGAEPGDKLIFKTEIIDEFIVDNFENEFIIIVGEPQDQNTDQNKGERVPPKGKNSGKNDSPGQSAIPRVEEVHQDEWERHQMDKFSALVAYQTEESYDFFINMDNSYFLTELKGIRKSGRMELTRARYKYSMTLIGMCVLSYYKDHEDVDVLSEIKKITSMMSLILIPMLDSMAELDEQDILSSN